MILNYDNNCTTCGKKTDEEIEYCMDCQIDNEIHTFEAEIEM